MRNGDALADGGGTELLALKQDFQNRILVLTRELGRAASSWIACFLLVALSAGMIAFDATRSVSVMDMSNDRNEGRRIAREVEGRGP